MKSKEDVFQSIKNKVARDRENLENAKKQLEQGAKYVILHGQDSYYDEKDITRMSLAKINSALEEIRYREEHMDDYIKNNIKAVAHNVSVGINGIKDYTPFSALLILDKEEYQKLIEGERKLADSPEELDNMIQEILEYYGYERNDKNKPRVEMSKFKQIYENSKGRLKQALEKLRGMFNKNKRLDNTQFNNKTAKDKEENGREL